MSFYYPIKQKRYLKNTDTWNSKGEGWRMKEGFGIWDLAGDKFERRLKNKGMNWID